MFNVILKSGFVIVKTFPALYRDYVSRYNLNRDFYAIPRIDKKIEKHLIQYRGLGRDALEDYENSNLLAEIRMAELAKSKKCFNGVLVDINDVIDAYSYLGDMQADYEIVWARIAEALGKDNFVYISGYNDKTVYAELVESNETIPDSFYSVGFEASYFLGDHFSPSCDCMLFPRWHGTDEEEGGILFQPYFQKLNKYGLFDNVKDAKDFLKYYLSLDWTEQDPYEEYIIIEVFIQNAPIATNL